MGFGVSVGVDVSVGFGVGVSVGCVASVAAIGGWTVASISGVGAPPQAVSSRLESIRRIESCFIALRFPSSGE